ncbi:MAG TPA: diacylglycerol kinase family lipid kinase, partial [Spirochaetales bacterium]|nr:diacylglycerol kinase family lipid kinase [Spirochaetales bacterium]
GKYFCNGIGIGFDTMVGLEAAKMKWVHGFMAYVLGAAKCFINFPPAPSVSISYNGTTIARESRQISVMNGKRMGGAFYMAPDAKNYDGLLNLCVSNKANRLQLFGIIMRYARGSQANDKRFICDTAGHYRIEAPAGGLIVHADGETICTNGTSLDIRCLPGTLSAIYEPELVQ